MVMYDGKAYFPFAKVYPSTEFGGFSPVEPDYKEIAPEIEEKGFILEPVVWWGYNESNEKLD